MRVRSRLAAITAATVLCTGVLAGCGSEGAQDAGSTSEAQSAQGSEGGKSDGSSGSGGSGEKAAEDGGDDGTESADGEGADAASGATPDSLKFAGTTVSGEEFDGSALAGKPVVLWFWAPWCSTCASQSGTVADLEKKHGDTVNFVGVSSLGKKPAMQDFVQRTKVGGFPQLADENGEVWKHFGITAQSTFVVLDAEGAEVRSGHIDLGTLREEVGKLAA